MRDLRGSLLGATRNGFAKLSHISGLELRVLSLLEELYLDDLPRAVKLAKAKIEKTFEGYSSFDDKNKRKAIISALKQLDNIESKLDGSKEYKDKLPSPLERSCQFLKGVGPKVAEIFIQKGMISIGDLLYLLPNRYEDRKDVVAIANIIPGTFARSKATIVSMSSPANLRYKKAFEVMVDDGTGVLTLSWFHYGALHIPKKYSIGNEICLAGKVGIFRGRLQIVHPEISFAAEEEAEQLDALGGISRIRPIYPEIQGINRQKLRFTIQRAAGQYSKYIKDPLPEELIQKMSLPSLSEALYQVHLPGDDADVKMLNSPNHPARRRMIFDEFFFLQLALAHRKRDHSQQPGVAFKPHKELARKFYANFSHKLTQAQRQSVHEIAQDMQLESPMNRLLQGDVGSGKTVVAVLCALMAIENGYQVALMAPTEILAEQHYRTISKLCDFEGVNVGLLTSQMKAAPKRKLLGEIATGHIDFAIGTHALIQKSVDFRKLGFVIVDEQHRFGVQQRSALRMKGLMPHCLVMSATPIPRSMSLTLYGDLDISIINEIPPGRTPIKTSVLSSRNEHSYLKMLKSELDSGRQAYIVYPLVEESENLSVKSAVEAKQEWEEDLLSNYRVGLLHGQMAGSKKELVMQDFVNGKYDVLVATTVVEVGVDVPNATVMIVEDAQRFGLAQLHQLRGRIGRGKHPGHCFLVTGEEITPEAIERLSIMEETSDGFKIAETDLAMRGPGEFLGTRQTGTPAFRMADLVRDEGILEIARKEAFELYRQDPMLEKPNNNGVKTELLERWADKLEMVKIG